MLIHHHQLKTLVEEQHNSKCSRLSLQQNMDLEGDGSVKYRANIGFRKSLKESDFSIITQAELNSAFFSFFSTWKLRVVGKLPTPCIDSFDAMFTDVGLDVTSSVCTSK